MNPGISSSNACAKIPKGRCSACGRMDRPAHWIGEQMFCAVCCPSCDQFDLPTPNEAPLKICTVINLTAIFGRCRCGDRFEARGVHVPAIEPVTLRCGRCCPCASKKPNSTKGINL